MRVKVKKDSKISIITAFTGREFVKSEYRNVPPGSEDEAKRHPYLEVEKAAPKRKKAVGGK